MLDTANTRPSSWWRDQAPDELWEEEEEMDTGKIDELENRLNSILPENWENRFETHEDLAGLFERSFDKAEAIARDAIAMLRAECK